MSKLYRHVYVMSVLSRAMGHTKTSNKSFLYPSLYSLRKHDNVTMPYMWYKQNAWHVAKCFINDYLRKGMTHMSACKQNSVLLHRQMAKPRPSCLSAESDHILYFPQIKPQDHKVSICIFGLCFWFFFFGRGGGGGGGGGGGVGFFFFAFFPR